MRVRDVGLRGERLHRRARRRRALLNPHLHVLFLDGAYHEDGAELVWNELGHLQTREVGQVLENAVRRMLRYLGRHGLLEPMITESRSIARFLAALGEPTDVPGRLPNRGPPYWKSTVLRRKALGDAA